MYLQIKNNRKILSNFKILNVSFSDSFSFLLIPNLTKLDQLKAYSFQQFYLSCFSLNLITLIFSYLSQSLFIFQLIYFFVFLYFFGIKNFYTFQVNFNHPLNLEINFNHQNLIIIKEHLLNLIKFIILIHFHYLNYFH